VARPENARLSRLLAVGRQFGELPQVETDYERVEVALMRAQGTAGKNERGRKFITLSLPADEYDRLSQAAEQYSTPRRKVAMVTVAKAGISLILEACERAAAERKQTAASRAAELLLEHIEDLSPAMKRKLRDAFRGT
jgi:hypothetical protein